MITTTTTTTTTIHTTTSHPLQYSCGTCSGCLHVRFVLLLVVTLLIIIIHVSAATYRCTDLEKNFSSMSRWCYQM